MSKLIIEDRPIMFSPKLAKVVGVSKAIILQQIHYWAKEVNEKAEKESVYRENYYWTKRTVKEWHEGELNFISERQLKRLFKSMEEEGLIIIDSFNTKRYDKTNWYRVNYEKLEEMELEEKNKTLVTKCPQGDKVAPSKGQNGTMDSDKMSHTIKETKKESKEKSSSREEKNTAAVLVNSFTKELKQLLKTEKVGNVNKNTIQNIYNHTYGDISKVKIALKHLKDLNRVIDPGALVAVLRDKDYLKPAPFKPQKLNRDEKIAVMTDKLGSAEVLRLRSLIKQDIGFDGPSVDKELGNLLCRKYNEMISDSRRC